MSGAKRGFCVIVSNNDFSKAPQCFKERVGTKVDESKFVFESFLTKSLLVFSFFFFFYCLLGVICL